MPLAGEVPLVIPMISDVSFRAAILGWSRQSMMNAIGVPGFKCMMSGACEIFV
jgi:hypothetical protein